MAAPIALLPLFVRAQIPDKRPMTFLDAQLMRQVAAPAPSVDGKWLLYTLSTMDWKEGKRQTDIALVSLDQGVPSTKQLTFTKDKNEKLRMEKKFSVAIRNMERPLSSLWMLDVDSRKATRLTRDSAISVTNLNISNDGKWVGFRGASANRYHRFITEESEYGDDF